MVYYHACAPLPPDENGVQLERDNKRDENVRGGERPDRGRPKVTGAGVSEEE